MHDIVHKVIDEASRTQSYAQRLAEMAVLRNPEETRAIAIAAAETKRMLRRQRNLRNLDASQRRACS